MADDIVSTVRLEGTDQVVSDFERIGKAGQDSAQKISNAYGATTKSLDQVGQVVEAASRRFGSSIRDVGSAVSNVGSNLSRITGTVTRYGAAVAAYIGIASRLAKTQDDLAADTKAQIAANRAAEKSWVDAAQRTREGDRALRDLNEALGSGDITFQQYIKQLVELQKRQRDAAAEARQRALDESAATEARIIAEAQIKKQADAQRAFNEATRAYGADIANALQTFGSAWERFMTLLNAGHSVIADVIRSIAKMLTDNGAAIVAELASIGKAFAAAFDDGSGKATDFGAVLLRVFLGISAAIKDVVIPAFAALLSASRAVAGAINSVFGTNISGEALLIGAVILQMVGAFRLLFAVVMVVVNGVRLLATVLSVLGLNPVTLAIMAVVAALVLLALWLSKLDWDAIGTKAAAVWDAIVGTWGAAVEWFNGLWQGVVDTFTSAWDAIKQASDDAWTWVTDKWTAVTEFFSGLWTRVKNDALAVWNELKRIFSFGGGGGGQQEAPAFARGGPIRGSGTSTSDNIPIWASPGEWVVRADAVRHYGRQFMAAINSMRFPRGGLDLTSLAAGLAPVTPRLNFATGGEVPGRSALDGRPVILQFGDGQSFALTAATETADRLGRYATARRLSSAGRKPSYYGT